MKINSGQPDAVFIAPFFLRRQDLVFMQLSQGFPIVVNSAWQLVKLLVAETCGHVI